MKMVRQIDNKIKCCVNVITSVKREKVANDATGGWNTKMWMGIRMLPRFFIYVLFVFLFGLIQFWLGAAILWYKKCFDIEILLRDGGLFFFSTSLVYTSFYTRIYSHGKGAWEILITVLALAIVSGLASVAYCVTFASLQTGVQSAGFSGNFMYGEGVCLAVSAFYSVFAHFKTGAVINRGFAHL